jgi:uncharacterized phiE125 gp8 family phage protein
VPLSLVTAPTLEPVSLVEARAQCRVDSTEEDGLIAGYMLAARDYVETYTRRALMAQTWEQTVDELGGEIVLKKPPIQSVTSVKYTDVASVEQTLASNQYRLVRRDTGEHVIVPAYGVTWPTPQDVEGAVTVRFVAGYGTSPGSVPEKIRQAILLLVAHYYAIREPVLAGVVLSEVPLSVDSLLFPHRAF